MRVILQAAGRQLARYLAHKVQCHGVAPATSPERLLAVLRPGDVLLVEGHSRFSTAVKYLTQSTWSHAALFVGDAVPRPGDGSAHCFVEADLLAGVRSVGLQEYAGHHTRICRPLLDATACRAVCDFAIARIGTQYDLRNIIDLVRYTLPTPPVPTRVRRRMLAFGSGDPTRAICSTLIAQAFQSIRYPILPIVTQRELDRPDCAGCLQEYLHIRHHSLFTPRDFDVSPYFAIVKPTLATGFDYRSLQWEEEGQAPPRTFRLQQARAMP